LFLNNNLTLAFILRKEINIIDIKNICLTLFIYAPGKNIFSAKNGFTPY